MTPTHPAPADTKHEVQQRAASKFTKENLETEIARLRGAGFAPCYVMLSLLDAVNVTLISSEDTSSVAQREDYRRGKSMKLTEVSGVPLVTAIGCVHSTVVVDLECSEYNSETSAAALRAQIIE